MGGLLGSIPSRNAMCMGFLAQNIFTINSPKGIQERADKVRQWAWFSVVEFCRGRGRGQVGGASGRQGRGGRCNTHCTAWAEPFTVRDLRQRRVEAVQVVGRRAGVTAQELAAVLAHAAELHVVILLLLAAALLLFLVVILRLPLDPLLLL